MPWQHLLRKWAFKRRLCRGSTNETHDENRLRMNTLHIRVPVMPYPTGYEIVDTRSSYYRLKRHTIRAWPASESSSDSERSLVHSQPFLLSLSRQYFSPDSMGGRAGPTISITPFKQLATHDENELRYQSFQKFHSIQQLSHIKGSMSMLISIVSKGFIIMCDTCLYWSKSMYVFNSVKGLKSMI